MDKEILERRHSEMMNREAVERIKHEEERKFTAEEAERIESVFFEDDAEVRLRDGKVYKIQPFSLRDARKFAKLLRTVNIDAIIVNFVQTNDPEEDEKRQEALFEIMRMAFKHYPHIDDDYIDRYVDLNIAREIISILIGLNGLKK